jgi:hypothetical protein
MPIASSWPIRIQVSDLNERDARIDAKEAGGRGWQLHMKRRSFDRVGRTSIITVDRTAFGALTFNDVHGVPLEVIAWEQERTPCRQ